MRLSETPVLIPNTMVKPEAADGTMLETIWESRWLPDYKKRIYRFFKKKIIFLLTQPVNTGIMYIENRIQTNI